MRAKLVVLIGMLLVVPLLTGLDISGPAEAAVKPRLTLSVAQAPIAQTAGGYANRTVFKGRVTPARKGAAVSLQRKVGARWVNVGRAVQNRYGVYEGMYVARQTETLRVRSKPGKVNRLFVSKAKVRKGYKLKFGDNFTGRTLNSTRWQTRHQDFSGLRKCARPDARNARLMGDGKLTLSVTKLDNHPHCKYGRWTNGMIGTKALQQPYGFFAARVKFQAAPGMHGAFWLQGPSVTGAEIDVAEYFGACQRVANVTCLKSTQTTRFRQQRLATIIHHTDAQGKLSTFKRIGKQLPTARILGNKKTPANSYHVYAVSWTPTRYQFFLDGKLTVTVNRKQAHVSSAASEIVLSLLSSDSELSRLKNPKSVMKVDWVRAWKAK